jgi:hypothetical protein
MNFSALSSREVARIFGATPSEVTNWVRDGAPHATDGGVRSVLRFDSQKLFQWLVARAREDGDPNTIADAKRRDRQATAALKEFKVAELQRETLTRTDAIAIYSDQVSKFRQRLLEMPGAMSRLSADDRAELEQLINLALAEFSGIEPEDRAPREDSLTDVGSDDDADADIDFG